MRPAGEDGDVGRAAGAACALALKRVRIRPVEAMSCAFGRVLLERYVLRIVEQCLAGRARACNRVPREERGGVREASLRRVRELVCGRVGTLVVTVPQPEPDDLTRVTTRDRDEEGWQAGLGRSVAGQGPASEWACARTHDVVEHESEYCVGDEGCLAVHRVGRVRNRQDGLRRPSWSGACDARRDEDTV